MTIRAKLYAAIVLTILGPLATTAVALPRHVQMGDRSRRGAGARGRLGRSRSSSSSRVTDMNGWQTAYGYDNGRSRPVFERSRPRARRCGRAPPRSRTRGERGQLAGLSARVRRPSWPSTRRLPGAPRGASSACADIFLGPEIARFSADGGHRGRSWPRYQAPRDGRPTADPSTTPPRRTPQRLITVALGAGIADRAAAGHRERRRPAWRSRAASCARARLR